MNNSNHCQLTCNVLTEPLFPLNTKAEHLSWFKLRIEAGTGGVLGGRTQYSRKDRIPAEDHTLYRTHGAKRAAIFVHGIGGTNNASTWGQTESLLRYEAELESVDFCFWGYETSTRPAINWYRRPTRGKRLSSVPELSHTLLSLLVELGREYNYEHFSLIGHSLGGHVSMLAASLALEDSGSTAIDSISILASPQERLGALRPIALGNPQLAWLAKQDVGNLFVTRLLNIRKSGIKVRHVHFANDEILNPKDNLVYDERITCQGNHSAISLIRDETSEIYRIIRHLVQSA